MKEAWFQVACAVLQCAYMIYGIRKRRWFAVLWGASFMSFAVYWACVRFAEAPHV